MADKDDKNVTMTQEQFDALQKGFKDLTAANDNLTTSNKKYEDMFAQLKTDQDGLAAKLSAGGTGNGDGKVADPFEGVDLERLSMTDLTGKIMAKTALVVEETINAAMKPIADKLDTTANFVATSNSSAQLKSIQSKHKDFNDWLPEVTKLSKDFPGANIEQLYTLVKADNPDKAKEMDTKYKDPQDGDGESESDNKNPLFGGLAETSSTNQSGEKSNMTQREASESAWEKTFGSHVNVG